MKAKKKKKLKRIKVKASFPSHKVTELPCVNSKEVKQVDPQIVKQTLI